MVKNAVLYKGKRYTCVILRIHTHIEWGCNRDGTGHTQNYRLTSKYNVEEADRRNEELGAHSYHVLVNQGRGKNGRKGCKFAVRFAVHQLKDKER